MALFSFLPSLTAPSLPKLSADGAWLWHYLSTNFLMSLSGPDAVALAVAHLLLADTPATDTARGGFTPAEVAQRIQYNPFISYSARHCHFESQTISGRARLACVSALLSIQQMTLFAEHNFDITHSDAIATRITSLDNIACTEEAVQAAFSQFIGFPPQNPRQRALLALANQQCSC